MVTNFNNFINENFIDNFKNKREEKKEEKTKPKNQKKIQNAIRNGEIENGKLIGIEPRDGIYEFVGDLDLRNGKKYINITELPVNLHITGDMIIDEYSNLQYIPNGLKVWGDLDINSNKSIKSINNMYVDGNCSINGCTVLNRINGITIKGDCTIYSNDDLDEITGDVKCYGDLHINFNSDLMDLCSGFNLSVRGRFDLDNIDNKNSLSLSDNITIGGDMNMENVIFTNRFPKHMKVGGDVRLLYSNFNFVRKNQNAKWNISGDLIMSKVRLRLLPSMLHVWGNCDISDNSIPEIHDNVVISGKLYCAYQSKSPTHSEQQIIIIKKGAKISEIDGKEGVDYKFEN